MFANKDKMNQGQPSTFSERVFAANIAALTKKADYYYTRLDFREVITTGFFDMLKARDEYRKQVGSIENLNWSLINLFIRTVLVIMAPITSHTCEHLWMHELKEKDSIFMTSFPAFPDADLNILEACEYVKRLITKSRNTLSKVGKKQAPPSVMRIYVSTEYPAWNQTALRVMKEYLKEHGTIEDTETHKLADFVRKHEELTKVDLKKVMAFVGKIRGEFKEEGESALNIISPFDEIQVLEQNADFIAAQLGIPKIVVRKTSDTDVSPEKPAQLATGAPGKPLTFWS